MYVIYTYNDDWFHIFRGPVEQQSKYVLMNATSHHRAYNTVVQIWQKNTRLRFIDCLRYS